MRNYITIVEKLLDAPTPTVEELADRYGVDIGEVETQLARGMAVESEHTHHEEIAREIALDHLGERLDYYEMLAQMESHDED